METRKVYQDSHVVIDLSDRVFNDFLDAQSPKTKKTYGCLIRKLIEYSGQSGSQILANRKEWNTRIMIYLEWLKAQGYSDAYATTATAMLRGFFDHYHKPLLLNRAERIRLKNRNRNSEDYLFDVEDVKRMAQIGNLKEKYVVLCGISFGFRSEDFTGQLTYGTFRALKLDSETPISIGKISTSKEHVPAYPFINSDALPIIKAILDANKDAKDNERIWKERPYQLSVVLQNLAKKSGIDPHGKTVRFHNLRKYLIDRLSAHMSESKWKQIVGKKISESAYVSTSELREGYAKAMSSIVITNGNGKVKQDLAETKSTVEQLVKLLSEREKTIQEQNQIIEQLKLGQSVQHKTIINMQDDLAEIRTKLGIKEKMRID